MKKIIVPTDLSKSSLNALEVAINIAMNDNAIIQILHINDIIDGVDEGKPSESGREIFEAMAETIQLKHGIKTEIIMAEGMVGQVIAKTAFEYKACLVVMGSHGISGTRELFIGSNAYYVVKRASCPVLLIPEGNKSYQFEKILLPVQQTVFSLRLFEIIEQSVLVNYSKCIVKIIGITSVKSNKAMPQFLSAAEDLKNKFRNSQIEITVSQTNNRNVAESVLLKAEQFMADLIVISPGLDVADLPFFIGPFSQRIINHSKIPILSILRNSV